MAQGRRQNSHLLPPDLVLDLEKIGSTIFPVN
jgi:hypothetical protein